jgi:hypothetical protein
LISICCQVSRSLVSALEQVGKHQGRAGCCLACGGSAGIAAGRTLETLGEIVDGPLQAPSSSASGNSVSDCTIDFPLSILHRLVD